MKQLIEQAAEKLDLPVVEREEIVKTLVGQAQGYGVLQDFFTPEAQDITEIIVNPTPTGPKIFYGKQGKSYQAEKSYFKDNESVLRYCQKICEDVGRPLTSDAPIVDAWLH